MFFIGCINILMDSDDDGDGHDDDDGQYIIVRFLSVKMKIKTI
jgi:hypothetical protein